MRIFSPLPGEYIASALKRGNELLGIQPLSIDEFYIKSAPRGPAGLSRNSRTLRTEWREQAEFEFPPLFTKYNIEEHVLKNNTLYPLYSALGRTRTIINVTPAKWTRICPDCVREDYEAHGCAFVHTRHVEAFVRLCSTHATALLEECPYCTVPIRKHGIAKLGFCGRNYERFEQYHSSREHQYAKFIAGLLNYRGEMVEPDIAGWLVHDSTWVQYSKEINLRQMHLDVPKIINRELGVEIKPSSSGGVPYNAFPLEAFIGCMTSEHYLDLLDSGRAQEVLRVKAGQIRGYE
ncbi:TniQ family protein [Pseudomonas sp. Ps21-P2]|jgi:hypothetical protein|uniref:TniQ family protein n=1 Tax=Pseudomonas sp. Ps21-P2 TaxID=3080331 RepID=UPI00320AADCD